MYLHMEDRSLNHLQAIPDHMHILDVYKRQRHVNIFRKYTGEDLKVNKYKVFFYVFISRIFGLTFGIKLQEKAEEEAQKNYKNMLKVIPEMKDIIADEEKHEAELISMIYEEKLSYMSSVVLGLNDALVELTGALALSLIHI